MDSNIITFLACICFIFIFGRIFIFPLKKIFKLLINSILGGACIYIINLVGANFGFHIGLNFFTSIIVRFVRYTWSSLLDYYKIINWLKIYFQIMLIYSIMKKIAKWCSRKEKLYEKADTNSNT